ncbi:MAG: Mur ligase domain-containing protein [Holosporales bacterium]|jgi:UDP-N-acetylmuramoyl-tripeptide--D-alanyl-D-alanine ligase|nr:Mur ligase domain-containing protein [Holosporales bacterium]
MLAPVLFIFCFVYIILELPKRTIRIGNKKVEFIGISIDSRTTQPGNLFFGLSGKSLNGNQFAIDAIEKGASAAVIDDASFIRDSRFILVKNSLETLKETGLYIRNLVKPKTVIGITGSVGKTTTKLWLNEILNHRYMAFASENNYNTIYGIPICFSMLRDGTEFCILEFGTNCRGEILDLTKYAKPDIGIITNIFESHIGCFNNKSEIVLEKISIIDGIAAGGTLIYDGDSEFAAEIKSAADFKNLRTISVGFSDECSVHVKSGTSVEITTDRETFRYESKCHGRHYEYISACVIGTLIALNLEVSTFLPFFKNLKPLKGRGEVINCVCNGKRFTVIDGSYNASLTSMLASINVLSSYDGAKVAIIGQMKESGSYDVEYHDIVARELSKIHDIMQIYFIGERKLWRIFEDIHITTTCFEILDKESIVHIIELLPINSIVLLKGSNSIGLVKFIEYIKGSGL